MKTRVTVPLETPVVVDGRRYDELRLREPRPRDRIVSERIGALTGALSGSLEAAKLFGGIRFAARLANVPEEVVYALTEDDAERLGEAVGRVVSGAG